MKEDAPDHRKMKRLARLLKIPLPYANGIMERLWHHAGKYVPDGGIGRLTDDDIAEACGMPVETDCAAFVKAIEDAHFLDAMPSCRYFIHDWPAHCTHYTHNKIARQKAYFADGSKPSLKRLDQKYRPIAEEFYGVSAQTGSVSAQTGSVSAQTGSVSAQTGNHNREEKSGVSAQSGQKSAQSKPLRARERPTPTPTPTPIEALRKTSSIRKDSDLGGEHQHQHSAPVETGAVAAALREIGKISTQSVARFVLDCQNGSAHTESEIVAGIQYIARSITKGAKNPIGIVLKQVPPALASGEVPSVEQQRAEEIAAHEDCYSWEEREWARRFFSRQHSKPE